MSQNIFSCGCPSNFDAIQRDALARCTATPSGTKVIVKFRLNQHHTVVQVYEAHSEVSNVIDDVAGKFQVKAAFVELTHEQWTENPLGGAVMLCQLPYNEYGMIDMNIGLNKTTIREARVRTRDVCLDLDVFYRCYKLPTVFSVQIPDDVDKTKIAKELVVEIVNKPIIKSFVGGYRNKNTGIEYHDGFTQTGPSPESFKWHGIISEASQTIWGHGMYQNTHYDQSSQAFGTANELLYIPSASDYTIVPRTYESHRDETIRIRLLDKVRLIQRNFRRYLLRKLVRKCAAEYRLVMGLPSERKRLCDERLLQCYKTECIKKSFPRTREDFNMLVVQIHKWKQREFKRINDISWGGPRTALLSNLLFKEIELLNSVEKKYFAVRRQIAAQREECRLDKLGEPVRWVGYKNMVCEMDLLRTQKIRQLIVLHKDMKRVSNREERQTTIAGLVTKLEEEASSVQRDELISLLQRETVILGTKAPTSTVVTLRLRQLKLMVDIIKKYERTLTTIPKALAAKKLLCRACKRVVLVPAMEFHMNTMLRETKICNQCTHNKYPPNDFTLYRPILRHIRRDEQRRGALGSFAFIAHEYDIRHLIEEIWLGRSVLSSVTEHTELRLPRWHRGDDWSPWNCVCLTEEEANAHKMLTHFEELYDESMMQRVAVRHEQARLMFAQMNRLNRDFVESMEWWRVGIKEAAV